MAAILDKNVRKTQKNKVSKIDTCNIKTIEGNLVSDFQPIMTIFEEIDTFFVIFF